MFKKLFVFITVILFSLSFFTFAQENLQEQTGLELELSAFIVNTIKDADGNDKEVFVPATRAQAGQVIEYRVSAVNNGENVIPAASAKISVPIPGVTSYVDGSALENDLYRLEFSVDEGRNFAVAPLMRTIKNDKGEEVEEIIDPSEYQLVRWTILKQIEPKERHIFSYRVEVK